MVFKNYMEEAVIEEMNGVLEQLKDECRCQKCREDMAAWALNRLPPRYVVTKFGSVYTKINQLKAQTRADVVVQLMGAAKVVKGKPRH